MHIPVLQKEVLESLNPKTNENFIDCTVGEGGHSLAILEKNIPNGRVLGIEVDIELYQSLKEKCLIWQTKQRLVLVNDSYVNLREIVKRERFGPVSGILFDVGFSSWHLENSGRGFSFQKEEPLDMRYNLADALKAENIINEYSEKEIEKLLRDYGEEKFSKRIAKKIVEERKREWIKTTSQLGEIIKKAVPKDYDRRRIHPATRTFQALRIAVNDELSSLEKALPQALDILTAGGRLTIISFHSLEDRIVKRFLKSERDKEMIRILTKKPVCPSDEEIKINPRARSAKLRVAVKLKKIL